MVRIRNRKEVSTIKALVVYDSQYGNTEKLANTIARKLQTHAVKADDVTDTMIDEADTLIVGSPTQAWNPTSSVKSFLNRLQTHDLSGVHAAAFDTGIHTWYAGSAAKSINNTLAKLHCDIVAKPKEFVVTGTEGPLSDGQLQEAEKWAKAMQNAIK